ncbi:MAG: hypothetical protein U0229_03860 [Anaeromyxobacter sp.]
MRWTPTEWAALAVFALAAGLRLAAAQGDLWLDELWSVRLAEQAGSIGGVLRLHHDNNHPLNTAWLLLCGADAAPWLLRLPAVLSGATLAALALRFTLRPGRLEAGAAAALTAASPLLVQYGSEARGYALALLAAAWAYAAMDRWLEARTAGAAWSFCLAAVAGLLAHLTTLFVLAACAGWAATALAADRREPPRRAHLLVLALPAVALAALWAIDLRHLTLGGGPPWEAGSVLRELLRAAFGLPRGAAELVALAPLGMAAAGLAGLVRARDPRAVFFALVLALPPLAVTLVRPDYVAPRSFLVAVPFAFLLVARGLALAVASRPAAGAALVVAFLAAAVPATLRLVEPGRGHPVAAAAFLLAAAPGPFSIGGDHELRVGVVLDAAFRRLHASERVTWVPEEAWAASPPDWLVLHALDERGEAASALALTSGARYELAAAFPHAGLSGLSYLLYRRAP